MKIDPAIRKAMDDSGLPFVIERGTKHHKIKLAGKLVTTLTLRPNDRNGRDVRNIEACIRRAARNYSGETK